MKAIFVGLVLLGMTLEAVPAPSEAELRHAEPVVRSLLAKERAALRAGKMTQSEVAEAAMKLADKAEDEASKLLFMKGAFVLYARDGKTKKAIETLDKIESSIADISTKNIANMIDLAISDARFDTNELADCKAILLARRVGRRHLGGVQLWEDGPYWAECNVGASKPEDPGYYFWWGDTLGYEWDGEHWKAEDGSKTNFVFTADTPVLEKSNEQLMADGYVDSTGNLSATHDAVTAHLGAPWRMPTREDLVALIEKCDTEWATRNGVEGLLVKGKGQYASRNIFLPDSGYGSEDKLKRGGHCMSSTPHPAGWNFSCMKFDAKRKPFLIDHAARWDGLPIRPVRSYLRERKRGQSLLGNRLNRFSRASTETRRGEQVKDGENLTEECNGYTWTYRIENGKATIVNSDGDKFKCAVSPSPTGAVEIPSVLGGVQVTALGRDFMAECDGVTAVTIPNGVTDLARGVFYGCDALKSVNIPESVRGIDIFAFYGCTNLEFVTLPKNLKVIKHKSFRGCQKLKSLTIPEGLKSIEWAAIWGIDELTECRLPASVEDISAANFSFCKKLSKLEVAAENPNFTSVDNVIYTKDRSEVVASANLITSVTIPEGATRLRAYCFETCRNLENVTLPKNVAKIERGAFKWCDNLRSVTLLGERPFAGSEVFDNCPNLKEIHVPAGVKSWEGMTEWLGVPLVFDSKEECNELGGVQLWENGPFWAECNVGATKPEGSGYCFWWGDTVGYEWDGEHWNAEDGSKTNFVFSFDTPTGAKSNEQLMAEGYIDSTGNLSAAHDAATAHLGAPWRMPTHNDLAMLIEKCDTEWTSRNGVEGILVKGKGEFASRSIFIPDTGFALDAGLGKEGHCMSSTPNPDGGHFTCMKFNGSAKPFLIDFAGRNNGLPIRPVRDALLRSKRKNAWRGIPLVSDQKKGVDRNSIAGIINGMIKIPDRDYWISETELTQGQWEAVMDINYSMHNGRDFPVECVSRNDCNRFLEKLNATEEVRSSRFEFTLPTENEWLYAAQGGSCMSDFCWVSNGVAGNVLDMAWVKENSSNETHAVAMKMPNAFGLYDMIGNVWEWVLNPNEQRGTRFGYSFSDEEDKISLDYRIYTPAHRRWAVCGLRLAAHLKTGNVEGNRRGAVQLWEDGPYWAECNVGANKPEEYGEFFWWGDTSRTGYSTDKCQTFNKNRDQLRSEGYIDTTSNLAPEHDTATAYLGSSWRMPTDEEFMALMRNCDVALTKQNGVCGLLVAGRGEFAYKSIFLPAAGLRCGTDYSFKGVYGGYWASTPNMDEGDHDWIPRCARHFAFDKGAVNCYNDNRYVGHSVRAVRNDK